MNYDLIVCMNSFVFGWRGQALRGEESEAI
jgi:hypothetical protein